MQTLVVQRPHEDRIVTLRSRTLGERGPAVDQRRVLEGPGDLDATLRERFGIALDARRVERLWPRVVAQHEAWLTAQDPV